MSITIMKIIIKFNGWARRTLAALTKHARGHRMCMRSTHVVNARAQRMRTWSTHAVNGRALTGGGRAIGGGRSYQMRTRSSGGR